MCMFPGREGGPKFPEGPIANSYGNLWVRTPVPLWIRAWFLFKTVFPFTYLRMFHSRWHLKLCKSTLHGYKKSARDQAHDIWRLELGKVKNTTFLVKRTFLFLRTI